MEALNTCLVEDATRIPAPTKVVDALRRIIAEDFSDDAETTARAIWYLRHPPSRLSPRISAFRASVL